LKADQNYLCSELIQADAQTNQPRSKNRRKSPEDLIV